MSRPTTSASPRRRARITYAGASHGLHTLALESGAVSPHGFDFTYLTLGIPEAFGRMVRHTEFDASEMSLATYMSMVAAGEHGFVGLPIFPARYFRHRQLYLAPRAEIAHPSDLSGRTVGVADYHQTAALWIRSFLWNDYGVAPSSLRWRRGGIDRPGGHEQLGQPPPADIELEDIAETESLGSLLAASEIDALLAPRAPAVFRGGHGVRRLFPDYAEVERDYYRRTGIFPIMHLVVVSHAALERHPDLPVALLEAFIAAKRRGEARARIADAMLTQPWWEQRLEELDELFAGDPFPYGIEPNRCVLEAALADAAAQGLLARPLEVAELFAAATWEHPGG